MLSANDSCNLIPASVCHRSLHDLLAYNSVSPKHSTQATSSVCLFGSNAQFHLSLQHHVPSTPDLSMCPSSIIPLFPGTSACLVGIGNTPFQAVDGTQQPAANSTSSGLPSQSAVSFCPVVSSRCSSASEVQCPLPVSSYLPTMGRGGITQFHAAQGFRACWVA